MNKFLVYILFIASLSSCTTTPKDSVSNDTLTAFIKKHNKNNIDTLEYVLILPNTGVCGGCLNVSDTFLKEYSKKLDNRFFVILTRVQDLKTVRSRMGASFLNKNYVFADKQNELQSLGYTSYYPELIYMKSGDIIDRSFQSPDSPDTFEKLKEQL